MSKPLFIDEDVRVFQGADAAARLAQRNDVRFFEPERGVVRVDEARWSEAQAYERKTWIERNRNALDDRNREHRARFSGYRVLAGKTFDRGVELGCGPFTNLRLVLEVAKVRQVHLLDPLVLEYTNHPHCRFRGGRFGGVLRWPAIEGLRAWVRPGPAVRELRSAFRVGGLRGRPVRLEATTIEEFAPADGFDLVVLINVIEHCRDVDRVLAKVDEILRPGGYFVFHDKFLPDDVLRGTVETVFDAGHPLRIRREVVEGFVESRFDTEFRAEFRDRSELAGVVLDSTSVYYIGRRRRPAGTPS